MHQVRLFGVAAAVAFAAALGCAGPKTSVTQVWKAQAPAAPTPMRNVLVFAANMDEAKRRTFEDAFVERLAAQGVTARRSYELFPGPLPDREQARAAAERASVEGVLVVTDKGTQEVSTYVPGSSSGGFWTGYYGSTGGMPAASPGYVSTSEVANLEMTLWDTRVEGGQLVWSASTRTTEPDPAQGAKLTKSVVEKVVPEIAKAGFIPGPGG